jgi:hypothetical protein
LISIKTQRYLPPPWSLLPTDADEALQGATDDQGNVAGVDHDPRPRRKPGRARFPRGARGPGRGAHPPHPSFGVAFRAGSSARTPRVAAGSHRRARRSRQRRSCASRQREKRPTPSTVKTLQALLARLGIDRAVAVEHNPRHRPEGPFTREPCSPRGTVSRSSTSSAAAEVRSGLGASGPHERTGNRCFSRPGGGIRLASAFPSR